VSPRRPRTRPATADICPAETAAYVRSAKRSVVAVPTVRSRTAVGDARGSSAGATVSTHA